MFFNMEATVSVTIFQEILWIFLLVLVLINTVKVAKKYFFLSSEVSLKWRSCKHSSMISMPDLVVWVHLKKVHYCNSQKYIQADRRLEVISSTYEILNKLLSFSNLIVSFDLKCRTIVHDEQLYWKSQK